MWRVWVGRGGWIGSWWGNRRVRRTLGRPRSRWVDNIRMDLEKVGCGYIDWIGLAQDRDRLGTLVSAVMNLRVPWNAGNFLTSCKPVRFSRRTLHRGVSNKGKGNSKTASRRKESGWVVLQILGDDIGLFILMTSRILSSFWEAKSEKKKRLP
jgi:hypothetical protein